MTAAPTIAVVTKKNVDDDGKNTSIKSRRARRNIDHPKRERGHPHHHLRPSLKNDLDVRVLLHRPSRWMSLSWTLFKIYGLKNKVNTTGYLCVNIDSPGMAVQWIYRKIWHLLVRCCHQRMRIYQMKERKYQELPMTPRPRLTFFFPGTVERYYLVKVPPWLRMYKKANVFLGVVKLVYPAIRLQSLKALATS